MIIYEAVSTYQLLNAMVDSVQYEKKDVLLLLASETIKKHANYHLLNEMFSEIILYDCNYALKHTDEDTKRYFCKLLRTKDVSEIRQYKIYCGCPHHSFGYFLAITNTPFIFCEDGAGLLSRPEILIEINNAKGWRKEFNDKCMEYGLYDGNNINITQKRCNVAAQINDFSDEKLEHFDTVERLIKMEDGIRNKIVNFFTDGLDLSVAPNSVLLLTQHFTSLQTMTFEKQVLIYQYVLDYFLERRNVVIKPHPSDLMYYGQLFSDAQIIREKFPSELLPFVIKENLIGVATISSTGIFNLRGHYPYLLELEKEYETCFELTHRYFIAINLAHKLNLNIYGIGLHKSLADFLNATIENGTNITHGDILKNSQLNNTVLIVDDNIMLDNCYEFFEKIMDGNNIVPGIIFLNSKKKYCWYDYYHKNDWENILPISIKKKRTAVNLDCYSSLEDEVIYFYTRDEVIRKMVEETYVEKELNYTGIKIFKEKLTPEMKKIKMLEGLLEATEKKLLYYIERDKNENSSISSNKAK